MIKRIELKNFMSHEHTVIEPAAGLTVLVGPNNCGKSAVVAALQILCHNENSTYVLRHGEKECSVKVETDDGHTVEWQRKNSPSYLIDGVQFDRLGRSVPEELHGVLKMPLVESCEEPDSDVHFGNQKSPIFLLSSTAANRARFFGSSSDVIQLLQMQKRHKEKLQEAQREKVRLEEESRQLNAALSALEPIVEIDRQLKELEEDYRNLQCQAAECKALAMTLTALLTQGQVVARHVAEAEVMARLAPPAPQLPTHELADLIDDLKNCRQVAAAASGQIDALGTFQSPPVMCDTASLKLLCAELVRLNREVNANSAQQETLNSLHSPPPQNNTVELAGVINQVHAATRAAQIAAQRHDLMQTVQIPPAIQDDSQLRLLIESLLKAAAEVNRRANQTITLSDISPPPNIPDASSLRTIIQQLTAVGNQLQDSATAFARAESTRAEAENALREEASESACPICGGPLDPDRLLAGVAVDEGHDHV